MIIITISLVGALSLVLVGLYVIEVRQTIEQYTESQIDAQNGKDRYRYLSALKVQLFEQITLIFFFTSLSAAAFFSIPNLQNFLK